MATAANRACRQGGLRQHVTDPPFEVPICNFFHITAKAEVDCSITMGSPESYKAVDLQHVVLLAKEPGSGLQ
jgi:hypothetical protein